MKRIITILILLLLAGTTYAQKAQRTNNYGNGFKRLFADSLFALPFVDTSEVPDIVGSDLRPGFKVLRPADTLEYIWTGTKWRVLAAGNINVTGMDIPTFTDSMDNMQRFVKRDTTYQDVAIQLRKLKLGAPNQGFATNMANETYRLYVGTDSTNPVVGSVRSAIRYYNGTSYTTTPPGSVNTSYGVQGTSAVGPTNTQDWKTNTAHPNLYGFGGTIGAWKGSTGVIPYGSVFFGTAGSFGSGSTVARFRKIALMDLTGASSVDAEKFIALVTTDIDDVGDSSNIGWFFSKHDYDSIPKKNWTIFSNILSPSLFRGPLYLRGYNSTNEGTVDSATYFYNLLNGSTWSMVAERGVKARHLSSDSSIVMLFNGKSVTTSDSILVKSSSTKEIQTYLPISSLGTVTSVGVTSTGSTLTVTNSPVTTSGTINVELPNVISAGTYTSVTVDAQGRAIAGSTTQAQSTITNLQDSLNAKEYIDSSVTTLTISTNTVAIDCGNRMKKVFSLTLTANVSTITIANTRTNGEYTIWIKQDGTGSRTVAGWPTTVNAVEWGGGTDYTPTSAANSKDAITFKKDPFGSMVGSYKLDIKP